MKIALTSTIEFHTTRVDPTDADGFLLPAGKGGSPAFQYHETGEAAREFVRAYNEANGGGVGGNGHASCDGVSAMQVGTLLNLRLHRSPFGTYIG